MRIFFIGSLAEDGSSESDKILMQAAFDLGFVAGEQECTVLLGSNTRNTADHYVIKGLVALKKRVVLEVHRPRESKDYTDLDSVAGALLTIVFRLYDYEGDFMQGQYTSPEAKRRYVWAAAHAGTISSADVVITLGGGLHTKRAAAMASAMGVPVVAIPQSGGESFIFFHDCISFYNAIVREKPELDYAGALWSIEKARSAMNQARFLAIGRKLEQGEEAKLSLPKDHSYFLSYSRENKRECDQIELLLRRFKREVLRDETHIPPGAELNECIRAKISRSQTFLALFSHSYRGSNWCQQEIEYALPTIKARNGRLVALLVGSDTSLTLLPNLKWLDARGWGDKVNAINELIKTETAG